MNAVLEETKNRILQLLKEGRPQEARAHCAQLCSRCPDPETWNLLGMIDANLGALPQAEAGFRAALALLPTHAQALANLRRLLVSQGKPTPADGHSIQEEELRRRVSASPHDIAAWNQLALALASRERWQEALSCYDEILQRQPGETATLYNSAWALHHLGQHIKVEERLRVFLKQRPDMGRAWNHLGLALLEQGRIDEALPALRRAVELEPDNGESRASLLFALYHSPRHTAEQVCAEHRTWGERLGRRTPATSHFANDRNPGRRLHVGYVSPDFRAHSVGFFIEPVLRHHNPEAVEIFCYSELPLQRHDAVTARLKGYAAHWLDTFGTTDDALAARVRADGIDILVDLAGHTHGNRLGALALRAAPIQVSYLGYVGTTGLPAMDWRISDRYADPPGRSDGHYTERLTRLPGHYCYAPDTTLPETSPLPAAASGRITFVSAHALAKINHEVVTLWAEVLKAVPTARLAFKARTLDQPATRERLTARFARHGIGSERLTMEGWGSPAEYIAFLQAGDIALDTFPFNGGTTTYHSLWMGLPVITLEGDHYVARMGTSILSTLDLPELIAKTQEDYVHIAANLACDPDRLVTLRQRLRPMLRASMLTDGKRYTRALEEQLREMWVAWCTADRQGDRLPGEVFKL